MCANSFSVLLVGLSVQGIKPSELKESEYYTEQHSTWAFTASMSNFSFCWITYRTSSGSFAWIQFTIRASSPATAQYVDLKGTLQAEDVIPL